MKCIEPPSDAAYALVNEIAQVIFVFDDWRERIASMIDTFGNQKRDELLRSLSYTADAIKTVEAALSAKGG